MTRSILTAASLTFMLLGCSSNDAPLGTGSASLSWQVGARGCETAGTPTVRVSLMDGLSNDAGINSWVQTCESGGMTIGGLRSGYYVFIIEALDENGDAEFLGESEQAQVRSNGVTDVAAIVLDAIPAALNVEWTFGGPLCAHVGVQDVEVLAFDSEGSLKAEAIASCETGDVAMNLDPGLYDIALNGIDESDTIIYTHVFDIELGRGDRLTERLELESVSQ